MGEFIRSIYNQIRTKKRLRKFFPVQGVQIEITTLCNLKCKGCYHNIKEYSGKNKHMSLDDFKKIIDQIPKTDELKIYGIGEPTLHPNIKEIVEYAKKSKKFNSIVISTNCLACKSSLFEELFRLGLTRIIISIDSMIQEEADELRRGTDIKKLTENIKYLNKEHQDKIGYATIVSKRNYSTIEKTIKILDDLGAKKISIGIFSNMGDYEHLILSPNEKTELLKRVKAMKTKNAKIIVGRYLTPQDKPCDVILTKAIITINSHLVPCCTEMDENAYSIGSLKEKSFKELFFSKKYYSIQENINKGKYPLICKGCYGNHTEYNSSKWNLETYNKRKGT